MPRISGCQRNLPTASAPTHAPWQCRNAFIHRERRARSIRGLAHGRRCRLPPRTHCGVQIFGSDALFRKAVASYAHECGSRGSELSFSFGTAECDKTKGPPMLRLANHLWRMAASDLADPSPANCCKITLLTHQPLTRSETSAGRLQNRPAFACAGAGEGLLFPFVLYSRGTALQLFVSGRARVHNDLERGRFSAKMRALNAGKVLRHGAAA